MDASFWHERWTTKSIGFHEGKPNSYLARFASRLDGHARVLVPLCGKSEDLAFLAGHGHTVVGVELVEDAVRQFVDEHCLTPAREVRGEHVVYNAGSVTIVAGDVLTTTTELLGGFDAVYDRAALVALPPDVRRQYVAHLRAMAPPAARVLLVAFEYDQSKKAGPPFAVMPDEVAALYAGAAIEDVASGPDPRPWTDIEPIEHCWSITLP
jgi:thiopurine S-methyltransferase